jgi:hypothetical protein
MSHHLQNNGPVARLHPSTVYVSDDVVNDMLNFGRSGDLAHADCHRGLTPFMCPAIPAKKRKEMDKVNERHTVVRNRARRVAGGNIRLATIARPVLGRPTSADRRPVPAQVGSGSHHQVVVRKCGPV